MALPLTRKLTAIETDMTVVKTLSHIFITNPMRMARDVYGFNGAIIASVGKAKNVVTLSAELIKQSADKAKNAIQGLRRNDKKSDEDMP